MSNVTMLTIIKNSILSALKNAIGLINKTTSIYSPFCYFIFAFDIIGIIAIIFIVLNGF